MCRLILGLLLVTLLMLTAFASAQENTNASDSSAVSDSSSQALVDSSGTAPAETTGDQDAAYGAEEMDQMIRAIGDDSSGAEEASLSLETTDETDMTDGTDDAAQTATQTGQAVNALEDDSGSTLGADQASDTAKEAKEMDHMIQTIEANGSTSSEGDQNAGASGAVCEGAIDLSVSTGISSNECNSKVSADIVQDSGALNQTKSMDEMIQTLAESDENGTSETAKDNTSSNKAEPVEQSIQTPSNGDIALETNAEASGQTEIQEETESMGLLIQTLAENEGSTDMATDTTATTAKSPETVSTETTGSIEEIKSIYQVVQALENYSDDAAASSNEGTSGENIEIVDEGSSMDKMIQALLQ